MDRLYLVVAMIRSFLQLVLYSDGTVVMCRNVCMLRLKDVTMSVSVADNADVAVLLLS